MNREFTFLTSVFRLSDLPETGLAELCIAGRSNVGKSSLINRLANRKNLAKISRKPGKTRSLNYYSVGGAFYLVDLPGYGYAKVPKRERALFAELVDPYLGNRQELRGLIQLIDARHGPVAGDRAMLDWLKGWDGRVLYVFTKADKLSANKRMTAMKSYREGLGAQDMVMFSAVTGLGLKEIRTWIGETLGIEM